MRCALWFETVLAMWLLVLLRGATAWSEQAVQPDQPVSSGQTTSVRGVVRNNVSGTPLPRALVRINGDAATGVLTDGDGRFEISGVPQGPQDFSVMKPGYLDAIEASPDSLAQNAHGYGHNVMVAPGMGDVIFNLEPVNSILGQIQLSTGDVGAGMQVNLLKRAVADGRAVWQTAATVRTNSEGVYRFGGLADGLYAVYTVPTMDNEASADLVEKGRGINVTRQGYAVNFYPDARDLASAAKIRLAGGDQAQANMTLALEPFQTVSAAVSLPNSVRSLSNDISVQVMNPEGHQLPYPAQYDSASQTAQTALPDGTYTMLAVLMQSQPIQVTANGEERFDVSTKSAAPISGQVSFAVAGRAVPNLRLPLATVGSSPVQGTVAHSADSAPVGNEPRVYIGLSESGGWMSDGMTIAFAEGKISAVSEFAHPPPGSYWVHTIITPNTSCEASFTAGGVSLAREPLVINETRSSGAPLVLALRDDCAKLTLSLPGSLGITAGEERFYTVYVVPDFDSTGVVVPQTLRLSTGGRITIAGLTPGNYHVYTFDRPVSLEYRNPGVLRELPSQPVTLAPGQEAEITVEAGQP